MANHDGRSAPALVADAIACFHARDYRGAERHALAVLECLAQPRETAVAYQLLGLVAQRRGRFRLAVEYLEKSVASQPDVPELHGDLAAAHTALARRLRRISRLAAAELHARQALRWRPDDPEAGSVLGVVLHEQGKLSAARQCFEGLLQTTPQHPRLRLNYANLLAALHEFDAAIEQYRHALALRPDHVKTMLSAAAAMLNAQRSKPAAQLLDRALQLDRLNPDVHFNLANAYVGSKQVSAAVVHFEEAIRLRPRWPIAHANWMRERAELCDWRDDWQEQADRLVRDLTAELDADRASPVNASQAPALPIPATLMRRIACRQTQLLRERPDGKGVRTLLPERPRECFAQKTPDPFSGTRLRIGYLSPDFRHHAIGHLMRSMFGYHDRDRFEVFTYSHGPNDGSDYRRRIESDSEHFVDVCGSSAAQITERIAADGIEVLVDVGGYAANGAPAVLAARPAPLLVHYLGFPSTLGGLVDYFVTDPVLTPPGSPLRDEFEEALIYLPNTYQMTDDQQLIADRRFTREECGLPTSGFVFAAFNNNYKIQPEIFDIWMQILHAVPDSVLWIVATQPQVADHLRREASARGVEPSRLVFASVVPKPEHLARHRLADLFLDTTVCCAHTTATDSLWAGVPLITCPGNRFTERVAASLLKAAGLEELIARDLAEYERLAIALATDRRRCQALRDAWLERRSASRLFDTTARVRQLEQAYDAIWQRYRAGLPPADITIENVTG